MPRPGPRPYECVRKAWHSDTHQPIRGYLIQEIFRIANEIHSSAIKNNRQWQEKLPVVVLKAEEIIYSKANSEAEYADFNTVWERANDAIDTIIRRDKTSETGHLLHPCVEAALHLGCTPRKFSRSQRNDMPRLYLTPEKNEHVSTCLSIMNDKVVCGVDYGTNCSFMTGNLNPFLRRNTNSSVMIQENLKSPNVQPCSSSKSCSVFPLYYGNQFLPLEDSKTKIPASNYMISDNRGKSAIAKLNASNAITRTDFLETTETQCDLSLRLGSLCWKAEENIRPKESDMLSQMDIETSFFPKRNSCNKVELASLTKRDTKSQNLNEESTFSRKRKAVVNHPSQNKQFCWQ